MYEENSRGLESPDCQDESTVNCPYCDEPILGLVTRGPSAHILSPCGCPVGPITARQLASNTSKSRDETANSTDGSPTFTFTPLSKTHLIGGPSTPEPMTQTTMQEGDD